MVKDEPENSINITCTDMNCPERQDDACQFDLDGTLDNLVRDLTKAHPRSKSEARRRIRSLIVAELQRIRGEYDLMEFLNEIDNFQDPPREYVTWRGFKRIRNVITDRIESITGERQ